MSKNRPEQRLRTRRSQWCA